jgi:cell division transport system permease protein
MTPDKNSRESFRQGASGLKVSILERWTSHLAHHRATFFSSISRMSGEPIQTFLSILVIAIVIILPSGLLVALNNAEQFSGNIESSSQITIFVQKSADEALVEEILEELNKVSGIQELTVISAQEALDEFKAYSGFGSALQFLDQNPLPVTILVQPTMSDSLDASQQLSSVIEDFDGVDSVQVDMLWMERLKKLLEISKKLVLAISLTLVIGGIIVIGNTIRLSIQSRREEIIVTKLVGGTDAYIRRPFLYSGLLLGFFGAFLSVFLLIIGIIWIDRSIAPLLELYQSNFEFQGIDFIKIIWIFGAGMSTGLLGSWLAVLQNLRSIEPR